MFSFLKQKRDLLSNVDIHSHLLPGIDDGAKDIETSVELIEALKDLGYKKLIITPHISDLFPNSSTLIKENFQVLTQELEQREIVIELDIAAEYYIDATFFSLLEKKDILSFGKSNYLLFEFSYFSPPIDIDNLVYEITRRGYLPVLAHPERYLYWHEDSSMYKELKEMGILFQVNLNSMEGYYNKQIEKSVKYLILNGMVDFIGTDTHHMTHIKSLKKSISSTFYRKIFKYNTILNDN